MASDTARKRELPEKLTQAGGVFALFGVDLRVNALEICGAEHAWRAMAWSGQEDRVQVVLPDQPVQMNPGECKPRACAPVSEEPVLDVLRTERLFEQRIVPEINHPQRKIVAGAPVCVGSAQFLGIERRASNGRSGASIR